MRFFGMISMIRLQWRMVLLLFYICIDISGTLSKNVIISINLTYLCFSISILL